MTPEDAALCERLKEAANGVGSLKTSAGDFGLCDQAAAAIERLSAAIKSVVEQADWFDSFSASTTSEKEVARIVSAPARTTLKGADQ